jgi:hypothetical protein
VPSEFVVGDEDKPSQENPTLSFVGNDSQFLSTDAFGMAASGVTDDLLLIRNTGMPRSRAIVHAIGTLVENSELRVGQ